jgi:hypothetical protein
MDMLPSSLLVPKSLGTDTKALDSTAHPPSYPARLTEAPNHNVKTILHSPTLEPISTIELEK